MRVVVQRAKDASVTVDGKIVGKINHGFVVFVGFTHKDTLEDIQYLVNKIIHLRIFNDDAGVMNKSILEEKGSILSISQFTLYADTKKGNRPSYINAMNSTLAKQMYEQFNIELKKYVKVECGIFKADMQVKLINDGPTTILIDSKKDKE